MARKSPTAARGGTITNVGPKRFRINWNQGARGKNIRLIVSGTRETAEKILHEKREEFYSGKFGIHVEKDTPVSTLVQLVHDDYLSNGYKDLRNALIHKKFWVDLCGTRRAESIDSAQLSSWAKQWREEGLSPARVNRRVSFLLRGFRLGVEKGLVASMPKWTALKEAPPRSGTRTWEEFTAVRSILPPHARVPVTIEYWLGTRSGETHALEWSQVSFDRKRERVEIRLKSIDTKTGQQRTAVMGGDLYRVLTEWREATKKSPCINVCQFKGRPLNSIRTAWQTACVKAGIGRWKNPDGEDVGQRGYTGALIHDFRRTAVSRMEDAGVPRKTAMAISGHRTDAVYRRYHIVRQEDLARAGELLLAHHEAQNGSNSGGEKVFSKCSVVGQNGSDRNGSKRVSGSGKKTQMPAQ